MLVGLPEVEPFAPWTNGGKLLSEQDRVILDGGEDGVLILCTID